MDNYFYQSDQLETILIVDDSVEKIESWISLKLSFVDINFDLD
jgi:hypothetical protein